MTAGHSGPHFNAAGLCVCDCRPCTSLGWCCCPDCPCDGMGDRGGEHVPDDYGELETGPRVVASMPALSPPPWFPLFGDSLRPEMPRCEIYLPPLDFLPFSVFPTPGEMWREAVAEASASLAGVSGDDWVSEWSCFRCAFPPAPAGDVFGLGARRIRCVRTALVPAWQAGKLLEVFAV